MQGADGAGRHGCGYCSRGAGDCPPVALKNEPERPGLRGQLCEIGVVARFLGNVVPAVPYCGSRAVDVARPASPLPKKCQVVVAVYLQSRSRPCGREATLTRSASIPCRPRVASGRQQQFAVPGLAPVGDRVP